MLIICEVKKQNTYILCMMIESLGDIMLPYILGQLMLYKPGHASSTVI